ncbi:MAG: hypothetical protein LBV34_27975 [Nocardiopsaceae bacterium]|jgi:ABC-type glycerol-3-phosphate transport system permease component|nr:hypothetical protein [Nocardiopsaceae bacterium]
MSRYVLQKCGPRDYSPEAVFVRGSYAQASIIATVISSLPKELDEAALPDECSYAKHIELFVIRPAWPSILTIFLCTLLQVWNVIIGPVVFLPSSGQLVAAVGGGSV